MREKERERGRKLLRLRTRYTLAGQGDRTGEQAKGAPFA